MKKWSTTKWLMFVAAVLAAVWLLRGRLNLKTVVTKTTGSDQWTVYGTMSCGWTKKQLEYMKSKEIPHKFVDCSVSECDAKAYPTLVSPDGKTTTGYTEM